MAVLEVLAEAEGAAVSRLTIMDRVWPGQVIADEVLTSCISSLRRQLGDDRRSNRFIETLPKRGYRLLLPVERPITSEPERKSGAIAKTTLAAVPFHRRLWVGAALAFVTASSLILWQLQDRHPLTLLDSNSIAVLPFDVYSERAAARHFADGLAEELIHQLTADPTRRVIARTSSFSFRNQNRTIGEMAEVLKVRHVLEGSIRDSSDGMRITVQLIDTSNDYHLWSRVFNVGGDNLIEVQQQVGEAVTRLIPSGSDSTADLRLRPRHPVGDQAYRLYLLGQSHMRMGSADAYAKAAAYFSDAIGIAPDYSLAYSQLAAAHLLLHQYRHDSLDKAGEIARNALRKALEIDPRQPEAHAVLGLLHTYKKAYVPAEAAFLQAIELQPKLSFARHNYGFMLWSLARFDEALLHLKVALDSNPLSAASNFLYADSLAGLGQFKAAKAAYKACGELLPTAYGCHSGLATVEQLLGNYAAAALLFEHAGTLVEGGHFWHQSALAALAIRQGDDERAQQLLQQASTKRPLDYNLLKSQLTVSLNGGRLSEFQHDLQLLRNQHPDDHDLRLVSALAAYFSADCATSIVDYEQELAVDDAFLFDYWDLESGFNHLGNLTYCYRETGDTDKYSQMLEKLGRHLANTELLAFPGGLYVQARFNQLLGDSDRSLALLGQLKEEQWPLLWLSSIDHVFADDAAIGSKKPVK